VLLELGFHGTLRDALLELALKVLELKVSHLESLGNGTHMRWIALGLLDARLQRFTGGNEEHPLGGLLLVAYLQLFGEEIDAALRVLGLNLSMARPIRMCR